MPARPSVRAISAATLESMPRLTLAILALALAALLATAIAGSGGSRRPARRPAPPLPSQRLSGAPVDLEALRGRPAFVNFWASWCVPCRAEAPQLERFARLAAKRARVVGVDWSDNPADARRFVARHGLTFPILRDASGDAGMRFGLSGLPSTFVLDAHGRIAERLLGPQRVASLESALARVGG